MTYGFIIQSDEDTDKFINSIDSAGQIVYSGLSGAALVDHFTCSQFWDTHTPLAVTTKEDMIAMFGCERNAMSFRQLSGEVQEVPVEVKLPWWKRIFSKL